MQIAVTLDITLDTVKKTWRRAYERVAHVAPYLLGGANQPGTVESPRDGKAPALLEYLHGHLEGLRSPERARGYVRIAQAIRDNGGKDGQERRSVVTLRPVQRRCR